MSCSRCEERQAGETSAWFRWGTANIEIRGCDDHLRTMFEWLRIGTDPERQRLLDAAPEMLEALKGILDGFAQGIFVRDISRDADSSWAVRLLPFLSVLGRAKTAIIKAEGQ